jgi:hypothetical protein
MFNWFFSKNPYSEKVGAFLETQKEFISDLIERENVDDPGKVIKPPGVEISVIMRNTTIFIPSAPKKYHDLPGDVVTDIETKKPEPPVSLVGKIQKLIGRF